MPSAMDELGRTVLTEDMTRGSAPMQCLSSAGARAAASVARPSALPPPTSRPLVGGGGARFVPLWSAAAGVRASAPRFGLRRRDRHGQPQRWQRAQRAVTGAEPAGGLEEDGHGHHACAPAPAPLL